MFFEVSIRHVIGEREIALEFASDEPLTALVGPSGAGKTTVLNAIAGLLKPDEGRIVANGEVLFDSEKGIDLPPELRGAGYVFQDFRLFPHMTVWKNLLYGEKPERLTPSMFDRRDVVDLLELADLVDRYPGTLSGGEARRVAIGRALLAAPRFLLLDEPMASLDAGRANRIRGMIEVIRDQLESPILLVSHDRAEVKRLAGRVVSLD